MYNNNLANSFNSVGSIKSGLNLSGILTGASKTLGFINQLIPLYYQVSPILKNAKTMFKIGNELKKDDKGKSTNVSKVQNINNVPSTNTVQNNSVNVSRENNINNKIKKDETPSSNLPNFFL